MKQKIIQFVTKLGSDPAHASRAILASFLIIGLTTATLNLGTINAELFGARLLTPLSVDEIEKQKQLATKDKLNGFIESCKTNRTARAGEKLIAAFENSFRGVLPGAGKLLLEEPATVQERKTKLIFEIITKYGELKYCLNKDRFIKSYGKEYQNDFSLDLQAYMNVKAQEGGAEPGKPLFIGLIKDEYAVVEKDMRETHAYVTDIVNRAIDSAIAIDQQTETRLASLASSTQLRLLAMGNAIGDINNEISNRQIVQGEVNNNLNEKQAESLAKIADLAAYRHQKCFESSEEGQSSEKKGIETDCRGAKYEDPATYNTASLTQYTSHATSIAGTRNTVTNTVESSKKNLKETVTYNGKNTRLESSLRNFTGLASTLNDASTEVQKAIDASSIQAEMNKAGADQIKAIQKSNTAARNGARGSLSFGLLNLVDQASRDRFLGKPFKLATIMYFAANNMVDVFVPGQEFTNYASEIPTVKKEKYAAQICEAVDPEGIMCFGQ